jgi:beta-mannosidase
MQEFPESFSERKTVLMLQLRKDGKILSEGTHYFKPEKELSLAEVEVNYEIEPLDDGYRIKLDSKELAKDVFLSLKDKDAFFSDNYFDLIPGQPKIISVNFSGSLSELQNSMLIRTLRDTY